MSVTKNIARYVDEKQVNISEMSRATGIQYMKLYDSLKNKARNRPLTVDEAILVCKFLGMTPMDFADMSGQETQDKRMGLHHE